MNFKKIYFFQSIIVLVAFSIFLALLYFLPINKSNIFVENVFIGLGFLLINFIASSYFVLKSDNLNELFINQPMLIFTLKNNGPYILFLTVFSFFSINLIYLVLLYGLFLLINVILFGRKISLVSTVNQIKKEVIKKTIFKKSVEKDLKLLLIETKDASLIEKLKSIIEFVQFSNPISTEKSSLIEKEILTKIDFFSKNKTNFTMTDKLELLDALFDLIKKRNALIKTS